CVLLLRRLPEGLRLFRTPVNAISNLHAHGFSWGESALKAGVKPIEEVSGELLDVKVEFEPGSAAEFGITLRGEPVTYSVKDKKLSALGAAAPLEPDAGRIRLRVLLDRTSLEVFGNDGRVSLTSCFLAKPE